MRIVTKRTIHVLAERYPLARKSLFDWFRVADGAEWTTPHDVKATFAKASIVNHERVVFNIHGNDFRLIVAIDYQRGILFVKWFGSHADYDHIDATTITWRNVP